MGWSTRNWGTASGPERRGGSLATRGNPASNRVRRKEDPKVLDKQRGAEAMETPDTMSAPTIWGRSMY